MSTQNETLDLNQFVNSNFDANVSEVSTTSELFIGVGKYKVVKVEAAEELDSKGQRRIKIVFAADDANINSVVSKTYWIKNEENKSATKGTPEYINAFGKATYAADEAAVKAYGWFDVTGLRPAKVGESELTKDIRVLRSSKSKDQLTLNDATYKMLEEGDVRVLEALVLDKKAQLMVGTRKVEVNGEEKLYSTVYPVFKPSWVKNAIENFAEMLEKDADSEYPNYKENETFAAVALKKFEESDVADASAAGELNDLPF